MIIRIFVIAYTTLLTRCIKHMSSTRSIEEIFHDYDDDRNAMVAVTEKDEQIPYEDFYDEIDPRKSSEQSMDVIYFGPSWSFMRLDTESILHILVNTKKSMLPLSKVILAWDIVTDGMTPAFLQGREYVAFGELLNVVPEEDLYYVNFGDSTVLRYFAYNNVDLIPRKYGILAAAYKRYHGDNNWYTNSSYINELGYLICGFPASDLAKIKPEIFININVDVFSKLRKCSKNQTETLYHIATHPDAFGVPYKWSSHEINRLEYLFTCIHLEDVSSLQFEAVGAISAAVMHDLDFHKVEKFTKHQILNFNSAATRVYIQRMQLRSILPLDKINLGAKSVSVKPILMNFFFIVVVSLICNISKM